MDAANKAYRVAISPMAANQLASHAAFLANVNEPAAERLVQSFEAAAGSLRQAPLRCPWLRGSFIPANTYRCLVFEKRYMLIYQVKDQSVYVDYVVDCRQDYQWLLRG